ncbi:hypothetical protein Tco_1505567 [Tanacetum coccineum]
MQKPMQNPEDILDPTTAIDMALVLMAKAFKLNNTTPKNNNQRSSSNSRNMQIARPGNQNGYNAMQNVGNQLGHNAVQNLNFQKTANQSGNENVVAARAEGNGNGNNENQIRCYNCLGVDHYARNCTVKPRKKDVAYLQTQLQIAQKEEAGIQLNSKEFDFMVAAGAYDEIEDVDANCTLKDNLQQTSTMGTQSDKAPVYDSDGSAEEADESLAKHKALEYKIERLLREVEDSTVTKRTGFKSFEGLSDIGYESRVDHHDARGFLFRACILELLPSKDDVLLSEEKQLPIVASPTADSPGYILESDPEEDPEEDDDEDPEEDPTDYPTDRDDEEEEEEPSRDEADD